MFNVRVSMCVHVCSSCVCVIGKAKEDGGCDYCRRRVAVSLQARKGAVYEFNNKIVIAITSMEQEDTVWGNNIYGDAI